MQITNAIKKLNKAGFKVSKNGIFWTATGGRRTIYFVEQGISIDLINVRDASDKDDITTDYIGGIFCDSLAKAILLAR